VVKAASQLSSVKGWVRNAAHGYGRQVDEAMMHLPREALQLMTDVAQTRWPQRFCTDYPQLRIDPAALALEMKLRVPGRD
jgi:hypothetical protein